MATVSWTGGAVAVAQVSTASIDSVDATPANNTFTVTIGGVAISQAGDTDVATTAAALVALLNASTHVYFSGITWTNPTAGDITGTADTAGVPFTAALTETGAGTGAVTDFSDDTLCTGPNFADDGDNWSSGAVPGNSDTVIFRDNAINICWGLEGISATGLDVDIEKTHTGRIGLRHSEFATTADGVTTDSSADEYRPTYLQLDMTTLDIGQHVGPGSPAGSQRIKIDNDRASGSTTTIHDTGSTSAETGKPAIRLLMAHASADVFVDGGSGGIGIAIDEPGETSTIGDLSVAGASSKVYLGSGVTVTSISQTAGDVNAQAANTPTSINVDGGIMRLSGTFGVTTVTIDSGNLFPNATGTIAALNQNGGTVNTTESSATRTITTYTLEGGTLIADMDSLSITTFNEPSGVKTTSVS